LSEEGAGLENNDTSLSAWRRSLKEAVRFKPALVRSETGDCAGGSGFDSRLRDVERGLSSFLTNFDRLELKAGEG
jgi:hypothetical protein